MALAALPGGGLLAAGDFIATEQSATSGLARFGPRPGRARDTGPSAAPPGPGACIPGLR